MNTQIFSRCLKLKMSREDSQWLADNLDNYAVIDWSEWSNARIDWTLRETLLFRPVETTADKLRVGDTVKSLHPKWGEPLNANWRIIYRIERFPNGIQVWDDLNQLWQFAPMELVQTQLLQLL